MPALERIFTLRLSQRELLKAVLRKPASGPLQAYLVYHTPDSRGHWTPRIAWDMAHGPPHMDFYRAGGLKRRTPLPRRPPAVFLLEATRDIARRHGKQRGTRWHARLGGFGWTLKEATETPGMMKRLPRKVTF